MPRACGGKKEDERGNVPEERERERAHGRARGKGRGCAVWLLSVRGLAGKTNNFARKLLSSHLHGPRSETSSLDCRDAAYRRKAPRLRGAPPLLRHRRLEAAPSENENEHPPARTHGGGRSHTSKQRRGKKSSAPRDYHKKSDTRSTQVQVYVLCTFEE